VRYSANGFTQFFIRMRMIIFLWLTEHE
jgi:hypothetical protein